MNRCVHFAAIMMVATGLSAWATTEENIHKQFAATPGGVVVVDVDFGAIEVAAGSENEVVVDVWRKVTRRKKAAEQDYLKDHAIDFSASGSTISVKVPNKKSEAWSWGANRNEGKYTIRVPAKFDLQLRTSGGRIDVKGLAGKVNARTSGGGLTFGQIEGAVDAHTSGGGVHVSNCNGVLKLNTSGGGIDISGGSGKLEALTSGGGISVSDFNGPAKVSTSGGHITVKNATAPLDASTSGGSIEASLQSLTDTVSLNTSGGHITVRVPADAAFDLDAKTSAGHVSSDLPVTIIGKMGRDSIAGKVNGGGKQVHLRTSGGRIEVKKL